jgi:tRNA 2-thiocytidine biosynthesis protein TtcA
MNRSSGMAHEQKLHTGANVDERRTRILLQEVPCRLGAEMGLHVKGAGGGGIHCVSIVQHAVCGRFAQVFRRVPGLGLGRKGAAGYLSRMSTSIQPHVFTEPERVRSAEPSKYVVVPPKNLLRRVGRAIADFDMIRDGDRILLGLSGGKDSLSLLHILRHLQRYAPVRFELAVATVDSQTGGYDPAPLKPYVEGLGLTHHLESQPVMEQAKGHMDGDSFCSFCSRMRRGILYRLMREHGYNVLALGQHLDDLAESFLMSAFHEGRLNTMKAHYRNDAGDARVIRPLCYVRERQTAAFAIEAEFPVIHENCPACFGPPTRRQHMKTLLAQEERLSPNLFAALKSALRPLMESEETPPKAGTRA